MTPGLPVLDTTVQEVNLWLKALMERSHTDGRHLAGLALRGTLHTLRDRLPPENAVHLAAQLPMLLRGLYFEGWHMAGTPTHGGSRADFFDHLRSGLPRGSTIDPIVRSSTIKTLM
jgi:uncharacterized protein (DUF2267 family)